MRKGSKQGVKDVNKNTITIMSHKERDGTRKRCSNDSPKHVNRDNPNPRSHSEKQELRGEGGRGDAKNTENIMKVTTRPIG